MDDRRLYITAAARARASLLQIMHDAACSRGGPRGERAARGGGCRVRARRKRFPSAHCFRVIFDDWRNLFVRDDWMN